MRRIFLLVVALLLFCSACQNPVTVTRKPRNQPNTKWASYDERIVFSVNNTQNAIGELLIENERIPFYLTHDMGNGMYLYNLNVLESNVERTEDQYEYWICTYKSKKQFTATVKQTTFFKVGEKIEFHRVDD